MNFDLSNYVPVSERLEKFRADHPLWGLLSELVVDDGQRIVIKATVTDEAGRPVATGYAEEVRGAGPVNRTSAIENGETSAWGRALANLGLEVTKGIASREEMQQAQDRQPIDEPWMGFATKSEGTAALDEFTQFMLTLEDEDRQAVKNHPGYSWPMAKSELESVFDYARTLAK